MALVKFSVAFGFELRINPKIEGTIKTYYTMRNTHQKRRKPMPLRIRTICSGKGNTNRRRSPLQINRLNPVQYEFRRQRHSPCDWVRSNARSMAISNTPPSTIPRESRMRLGGHRPEAFAAGRREVGAGTSIIGK